MRASFDTDSPVCVWTWPNILTISRIAILPFFILAFLIPFPGHRWVATALFVIAAITDWFDGYLARVLSQSSPFGEFLDPVADKLVVATALVLLVAIYSDYWIAIPSLVIVCREITISALREWMAELGRHASVKVSYIGKVKTATQMASLIILISQPPGYTPIVIAGLVLMYVAVLLTLWSMVHYMHMAFKTLEGNENGN